MSEADVVCTTTMAMTAACRRLQKTKLQKTDCVLSWGCRGRIRRVGTLVSDSEVSVPLLAMAATALWRPLPRADKLRIQSLAEAAKLGVCSPPQMMWEVVTSPRLTTAVRCISTCLTEVLPDQTCICIGGVLWCPCCPSIRLSCCPSPFGALKRRAPDKHTQQKEG